MYRMGKQQFFSQFVLNNKYLLFNALTEDQFVILDLQIHQDHNIKTI